MNNGIIIILAYPETIVFVAGEWYLGYLRFFGIGKKNYVRAGHGAIVLIDKNTGILEYYDFGRYITLEPNEKVRGRVRGRDTDHELNLPMVANIENGVITNLDAILRFFATHPKLTHGEGTLYASVCDAIDYKRARIYIDQMQEKAFLRYAVFIKEACNCARFVTDALIASVTDMSIKKKLIKSKRFTPNTIGNVVVANTEKTVFLVSEDGQMSTFNSTVNKENRKLFFDRLEEFYPNIVGTIQPKHNDVIHENAQWLGGIGSGAWFELYDLGYDIAYRFRRISSCGNIDVDGIYIISKKGFDFNLEYRFVHYSNCKFFHIIQKNGVYKFNYIRNTNVKQTSNLRQKGHLV